MKSATDGPNPGTSPEAGLLLACLRAGVHGGDHPIAVDPEPGWARFMTLALRHGVLGLAAHALRRADPGVPPAVMALMARQAVGIAVRNAAQEAEVRRVLGALAAKGIDAIPIKGPILARRCFPDAPAGPSRDLDILIRARDIGGAVHHLGEIGYDTDVALTPAQRAAFERYAGQFIFHSHDGRFALEPHWAYAPATTGLAVDYDGVWQRAAPARDDPGLRLLQPEDEVLQLCIHGCKEQWTKLKWLADLAGFIHRHPGLDWPAIAARARAQRVGRILRLSLLLSQDLLAVETPLHAEAMADATARRLAAGIARRLRAETGGEAVEAMTPNIYEVNRFRLACHDSVAGRARYVWSTWLTPRPVHFSVIRLPDRLFPLYRLVKLVHDGVLLPAWLAGKRVSRRLRASAGIRT